MERADMLDLNCDLIIPGLMNLYNVFSVVWFLVDIKTLRRHFKTVHSAFELSYVCEEVSIFIDLFCVPSVNILFRGAGEFKQINLFLMVV